MRRLAVLIVGLTLPVACGGEGPDAGPPGSALEAAVGAATSLPERVASGEKRVFEIEMVNRGRDDWTTGVGLVPRVEGWGWSKLALEETVRAGEAARFSVLVTTPSVQAASPETFRAQMYADRGGERLHFGEALARSVVVDPAARRKWACTSVGTDLPDRLDPGATVQVTATLENSGTDAWPADEALCLAARHSPADRFGADSTCVTLPRSVPPAPAPGHVVELTFPLQAPGAPGEYPLAYQLRAPRGVGWFDDVEPCVSATVRVAEAPIALDAEIVDEAVFPQRMAPGARYPLTVEVQNLGAEAWPGDGSFALTSQSTPADLWGEASWPIEQAVAPGARARLEIVVEAPAGIDAPTERVHAWRMAKLGAGPFGRQTNVPVVITATAPRPFGCGWLGDELPTFLEAGAEAEVTVGLQNTGTRPWPSNGTFCLRARHAPEDLWGPSAVCTPLPHEVAPGASIDLPLVLVAPSSPGEHPLELQLHDGDRLGFIDGAGSCVAHRIDVRPALDAHFADLGVFPTLLSPREPRRITVTLTNTGARAWTGDVELKSRASPPRLWGLESLQIPGPVEPDAQVAVELTIRTPPLAVTPATATHHWQLFDAAHGFFGEVALVDATVDDAVVPRWDAEIVSQTSIGPLVPNEATSVTIQMKNTGTADWLGPDLRLARRGAPGVGAALSVGEIVPGAPDGDGATRTFDLSIVAPSVPGLAPIQWRMRTSSTAAGFELGAVVTTALQVYAPVCGDGIRTPGSGEACDDGNVYDGDGCSSTCSIEQVPPDAGVVDAGAPDVGFDAGDPDAGPVDTGPVYFDAGLPAPGIGAWDWSLTERHQGLGSEHDFVWNGRELVLSGGYDSYGACFPDQATYQPFTGTWGTRPVQDGNYGSALVFTGREEIDFSGIGCRLPEGEYTVYDPVDQQLVRRSSTGQRMEAPTAAWTGHELLIYPQDPSAVPGTPHGLRYDPIADTVTPMSTAGQPALVVSPPTPPNFIVPKVAGWAAGRFIVWGGTAAGSGIYDPSTDTWSPMPMPPFPYYTTSHQLVGSTRQAVWAGDRLFFWNGTGAVYDAVTNQWTTTSTLDAPTYASAACLLAWTGREVLLLARNGGEGRHFDPVSNVWTVMNSGAPYFPRSIPLERAVWTGSDLLVFPQALDQSFAAWRYGPKITGLVGCNGGGQWHQVAIHSPRTRRVATGTVLVGAHTTFGSVATMDWTLDGVPLFSGYSGTLDTNGLPDGPKNLRVEVTDTSGGYVCHEVTVLVDHPPSVQALSPEHGTSTADWVHVHATCSDRGRPCRVTVGVVPDSAPTNGLYLHGDGVVDEMVDVRPFNTSRVGFVFQAEDEVGQPSQPHLRYVYVTQP